MVVRAQTCVNSTFENITNHENIENWLIEDCTDEAELNEERIQIQHISGVHKIYCYPYNITIGNETQPCPNSTFMLESHYPYQIGSINHEGAFIDMAMTRGMRSRRSTRRLRRKRRSPIVHQPTTSDPLRTTTHITTSTTTTPSPTPTTTQASTKTKPDGRIDIYKTLGKLQATMEIKANKFREKIKKLPEALNMTRSYILDFIEEPIHAITDSLEWLGEVIRSLGVTVGTIGALCMIIVLVPVLEMVLIGIRIIKIPTNLWLGSARRIRIKMKEILPRNIPIPFKQQTRRWEDAIKLN